jgi:hypothetical protein
MVTDDAISTPSHHTCTPRKTYCMGILMVSAIHEIHKQDFFYPNCPHKASFISTQPGQVEAGLEPNPGYIPSPGKNPDSNFFVFG